MKKPDGATVAAITNVKDVTLSGIAEAGATVSVVEGTTLIGTATADANGAWSLDAVNLADGTHNFTTTVTDTAGNTSTASPIRNLTVDSIAPIASPVEAVKKADATAIGTITSDKSVTLSGIAEPGATVTVVDGTTVIGTVTADVNGTWSLDAVDLAEGTHNFTTTVTDTAGNTSTASPIRGLTVDSIAPVSSPVSTVTKPDGAAVTAITNVKDVTLSGIAEAGATVTVVEGTTLIGTVTADANGAWSLTATNLAEGDHNFATTVTDAAGNTSTASPIRNLTVDSIAPIASAVATASRPDGSAIAAVTNVKDVTLSGIAEAGATVSVVDGTTLIGTATADTNGAWRVTATNLAEGDHNFATTVTDAAGNTSTASPIRGLIVDSIAPIASPVATVNRPDGAAVAAITNVKDVTLSGIAEAGAAVTVVEGTTLIGTATADANGAWSVTATGLADGNYSFSTTVTDSAGNTSAASPLRALTIDTQAPVITSNGGGATATVSVAENDRAVATASATDMQSGSIAYALVGGADRDLFAIDAATGALAFLAAPDYERPLDAGADNLYDVVVEARDIAGNTATQALSVAVTNIASETVPGDDGDNLFVATPDYEVFQGLGGSDTVSYEAAAKGIVVNLARPFTNRGEASGDSYSSIENLKGSAFNDKLIGDSRANVLEGGAGRDWLDGGRGVDTASYADAASGVTADLLRSKMNRGEAAGDTYRSIENLAGSKFDDTLVGNNSSNVIDGGDGKDFLFGRNGNDTFIGGLGADVMGGGSGRDVFVYRTPDEGADTIVRYSARDDTLQFSASGFGGGLVAGQAPVAGVTFIAGTDPVAPTTAGTFLYDTADHDLFWDADGSDAGVAVKIAHFDSPVVLTPHDFDIVA
ncbi:MAG: Ig-like domain-containing protein [Xanthobacteraceae bacterium]